jgi:hypothetical protein
VRALSRFCDVLGPIKANVMSILSNFEQTLYCALDKLLSTYKATMKELVQLPQDPTDIVSFVYKLAQLIPTFASPHLRNVETNSRSQQAGTSLRNLPTLKRSVRSWREPVRSFDDRDQPFCQLALHHKFIHQPQDSL